MSLSADASVVKLVLGTNHFIYEPNKKAIYSYCDTQTLSATCTSSFDVCTGITPNCIGCEDTFTTCTSCASGYALFSNVCYLIRTCLVSSCNICEVNETCVKCATGYILNAVSNTCSLPP